MTGQDRSYPFSMAEAFFQGLVRAVRRSFRGLRGLSLLLSALFCIGTCVCLFLITPAAAAGFVKEDCNCPLSGYSLTTSQPMIGITQPGTTGLGCVWTRQTASSSDRGVITVMVTKYPDRQKALKKISDQRSSVQSAVTSDKKIFPGYSCVEEIYGDTSFSTICAEVSLYYGMRDVFHRDTYVIELSTMGSQFRSGQELKSSFDQLETCMKRAADAHAGMMSGAATTIPAGSSQGVPSGSGTTTSGTGTSGEEEESLEDLLKDLGDEINEDLPLPVNWTAVPEAMSNSVTPAAVGALGALAGSSIGALALFFNGLAWPPSGGGGAGGRASGGQRETVNTQSEPETAGQPGSKPIQMVAGAIAKDRPVDKLGIPPLPESRSGQIPARISVPVPDLYDPGRQFCGTCGKPRRMGAAFCGNCGAQFR